VEHTILYMTMMIFDNMNLERINIKFNGTQHPTYEYQVNNEDLQRLYAAFLSCNYKKDLDEGTVASTEFRTHWTFH
jgi:hypothetical protein